MRQMLAPIMLCIITFNLYHNRHLGSMKIFCRKQQFEHETIETYTMHTLKKGPKAAHPKAKLIFEIAEFANFIR